MGRTARDHFNRDCVLYNADCKFECPYPRNCEQCGWNARVALERQHDELQTLKNGLTGYVTKKEGGSHGTHE